MTEERSLVERAKEYDASQIQVLEGLEAVRKRPGMYIGSTSSEGLHHLVWEIVDNSIDEVLAGFATKIHVTIAKDNSITVIDDGRGIPVDIQAKTGRPAVETVFTVLHAGGKFGGGGYKVSGGLHGVGSSVVNALSTQLDVKVYKEGNVYYQEYRRGAVVDDLKIIEQTDRHGTTVHFTPDPEIFTETTEFDFSKLATRIRELAFLNRGMRISIEDKREEEPVINEYHYDGGIKSYVEYLNANKTVIFPEPVYLEGEQQDGVLASDFLRRPEITYAELLRFIPENEELTRKEIEQVEIQIKYEGYIKKAMEKVEKLKRMEAKKIPENIDYAAINGLATEAKQKLQKIQPETIAQASRISGVNPADLSILMVYIEQGKIAKVSEPA